MLVREESRSEKAVCVCVFVYRCREDRHEGGRVRGRSGQTCVLTWLKAHIKLLPSVLANKQVEMHWSLLQWRVSVFTSLSLSKLIHNPTFFTFSTMSVHKYC